MEVSLASLSLEDSSSTSLISLPPELLLETAAYLPLSTLARFSLVSRFVRDAIQPKLYEKVELWSTQKDKLVQEKVEAVKRVLASLAADPERCELMRELDLCEWGWMGQVEVDQLELVFTYARRLKTPQMMNLDGQLDTYVPFFQKVWDVVLSLPELEALSCWTCPIRTPFQLQRLTALRRFTLVNLSIVPHEDGALPPLDELTLEWVADFDASWLPPKMLGCLRKLVLGSLNDETAQTITRIIQAWSGKATLEVFVVDLHGDELCPSRTTTFSLLQAALKLGTLISLEIHSTPWHGRTPAEAFEALERLLPLGAGLEHLVFAMARSVPVLREPRDIARLGRLLRYLPRLASFGTDLTTQYLDANKIPHLLARMRSAGVVSFETKIERLPSTLEATLLFGGHPTLRKVTVVAEEEDRSPEKPFIVYERDAAGGVQPVGAAQGWRAGMCKRLVD